MAEWVTLARPYAKAAFEVACSEGRLRAWQDMLNVAGAVTLQEKVRSVLSSPALTGEQHASLMLEICGDALEAKMANLVRALAANKRLSLLPEIAMQFSEFKAQQEKTLAVDVVSAFPLNEAASANLSQSLSRKWQCNVQLKTVVDPKLLGGIIIKAGDMVIDASVRGRITKLADALGA